MTGSLGPTPLCIVRQVATGDPAATFLDRLGGVAFWGSVSHHQSAAG